MIINHFPLSLFPVFRKVYTLLVGLLLTAGVFLTLQANAQAPQKMSYQSVLRYSSNVLLVNTAVGIKISVLQGSASGSAVYEETQTATTNANGLVSIQIGTGTATIGTFAGIDWANGPYFIKTETDPAGGTSYTITGTQEMLSVPYAMYSKNGITKAQADAIVSMQAQITTMQTQITSLNDKLTNQLSVGDIYQGGIIGYIFQSGDPGYVAGETHGLIAAQSDQSTGIQWYNGSYGTTAAIATAIGTGNANTNIIVSVQGAGSYAAKLCSDLVLNGYSDWYLPSKDELNMLYINKVEVGGFATNDNDYWSSSEGNNLGAWGQDFTIGSQGNVIKGNANYVRAVRAF